MWVVIFFHCNKIKKVMEQYRTLGVLRPHNENHWYRENDRMKRCMCITARFETVAFKNRILYSCSWLGINKSLIHFHKCLSELDDGQ